VQKPWFGVWRLFSTQGNSGDSGGHKPYEHHIINSFSAEIKEIRSIVLTSAIRTKQACIFWEGYEKINTFPIYLNISEVLFHVS
jgi:hypothetical protein